MTATIAKLVECVDAANVETATIILPNSPIIAERPKLRELDFSPLFQVWHECTLCLSLP
jgi:hypothetical protein